MVDSTVAVSLSEAFQCFVSGAFKYHPYYIAVIWFIYLRSSHRAAWLQRGAGLTQPREFTGELNTRVTRWLNRVITVHFTRSAWSPGGHEVPGGARRPLWYHRRGSKCQRGVVDEVVVMLDVPPLPLALEDLEMDALPAIPPGRSNMEEVSKLWYSAPPDVVSDALPLRPVHHRMPALKPH
eukprot:1921648-Pyramimonas_sp.AAC.1